MKTLVFTAAGWSIGFGACMYFSNGDYKPIFGAWSLVFCVWLNGLIFPSLAISSPDRGGA